MDDKTLFTDYRFNNFVNVFNLMDLGISEERIKRDLANAKIRQVILSIYLQIKVNGAILVKNQEQRIATAINSIQPFCDKIFIFDTGSTDQTMDVVSSFHNSSIVLTQIQWHENYAYMRNYVNDNVPDGWVLLIDSDEELQKAQYLTRRQLKFDLAMLSFYIAEKKDIAIKFKQNFDKEQDINWPTRLYKKTKTLTFFGFVHEEVRSTKSLKSIRAQLRIINHGSLEAEVKKFQKKERYYRLLKKNIEIEQDNVQWYAIITPDQVLECDQEWYKKHIIVFADMILKNKLKSPFNEMLLINYIKLLMKEYQVNKAITVSEAAFEMYSSNPYFLYLKNANKLNNIEMACLKMLDELKEDSNKLREARRDNDQWLVYNAIDLIPDIMLKLLTKAEYYDHAKELLNEINLTMGHHNYIEPEIGLYKSE